MNKVKLIAISLIIGFVILSILFSNSINENWSYIIVIIVGAYILSGDNSITEDIKSLVNHYTNSPDHITLYTINGKGVTDQSEIDFIEKATIDRQIALKIANDFLGKYTNIWGGLKLSNKFCAIYLDKNGTNMRAYDLRNNNSSYFDIISPSGGYNHLEIWNMLCMLFNKNLTYDELIKECRNCGFEIQLQGEKTTTIEKIKTTDISMPVLKTNLLPKIDINNCNETELSSLPGINIVTAKKIIKKREEINGFKSIEDVYIFLKAKPHIQEQLKDRIEIKQMKKNTTIKLKTERNIDL